MTPSVPPWLARRPFLLAAVAPALVLLVAYAGWIHPRVRAGSVARSRAALLEGRVASMREVVARGAPAVVEAGDEPPARRFDNPAALLPALAESALGGSEPVANLTIETHDRLLAIGFESSYARAGQFLWDLRGLPTLVDVRSLEVGPAEASLHVQVALEIGPVAPAEAPALAGRPGADGAVDVTTALVWGRNPFGTGSQPSGDRVADAETPAVADPVVRSILYSAGRRVALVDDRIVSVGAEVPAGRIVAIEPEAIVIDTPGGERRRVELSRPALSTLNP
ncbi:MAG: hypothetical protein HY701_04170 [Gemmatimonadetes bacterium]|nr:hypothetical protein [Gemmatimonadota bacterium]